MMYIEIEIPVECVSIEQKKAHFREIYEWGMENLMDQVNWAYVALFEQTITAKTTKIELYIKDETDAFAVKMTWS